MIKSDSSYFDLRNLGLILSVAVLYFIAERAGLLLDYKNTSVSLICPSSGLALAAILLYGYRILPGIVLGSFAANLTVFLMGNTIDLPNSVFASFFISLGDAAEPLLGFYLLKKFVENIGKFEKIKDVFKFISIVLLICIASAIIGTTATFLVKLISWNEYPIVWLIYWFGGVSGILITAPLFLAWAQHFKNKWEWNTRIILEGLILYFLIIITNVFVFGNFRHIGSHFMEEYLFLPLLLWAAIRFELLTVATAIAISSAIAILGTVNGYGPFYSSSLIESLLSLQVYIFIISICILTLKAAINERKNAELKLTKYAKELEDANLLLRDSEQQIQGILENAPDPVIVIDAESQVIKWNPMAETIFGWKTTEVMGKPIYEFIVPTRYRDKHKEGMNRFLRTGIGPVLNKSIEIEAINQQGVEFPISLSISSFIIGEKKLFIGFVRNITENKKVLEELKFSENFLNSIIENIPNMIVVKDAKDLKFIRYNKAGEELLGYSKKELIGKNDYDFFPKEEADYFTANDKKVLDTGKLLEIEEESIHTKDKGIRFLYTKKIPINDNSGKPVYLLSISNDITERKETAEQLRLVIESSPNALILINQAGEMILVNSQAEKFFGYNRSELLNQKIEMLVPIRSREKHIVLRDGFIKGIDHRTMKGRPDIYGLRKNGTELPLEIGLSPIITTNGTQVLATIVDITDRKAAIEELKRTNDFLNAILENIPNMIFVKDAKDLRFLRFNKAGEELLGYSRDEMIGKNVYDLFPKEEADFFTSKDREVLDKGKLFVIEEEPVHTKYKGVRILETKKIPINDISGKPIYLLGISSDISEIKKTAEELKRTNDFLNAIFENIPNPIFVKEAKDLKFVRINKAVEELIGYSKSELIGKNNYNLFPKEEADYFTSTDNISLNTGKLFVIDEEPIHTRYKGVRLVETKKIPIKDSKGSPIYMLGIASDITEQKNAEKEMAEFAAIVESSEDAIYSKSFDEIILTWNKGAEKIYGYTPEEAIGKSISIITPNEEMEGLRKIPEALNRGEKVVNFEAKRVRKDGKQIYVSLTASPIKGKDGVTTAISVIARDITESKNIGAEMIKISEELKRSNTELEQFAYVASHDLQEPLRMVTSYLQLLEKRYTDKLDQDAKEFIAFAVDGSKRMRTLIQSLLEYSRINRVKPFEVIDVNLMLKEVLENLSIPIKENNAIIKIDDLPVIFGDPILINRLFQNLIENAIKFHGTGNPEIFISGKKQNGEFLFSVKDNGIGIPKEYMDKLFIIFQRLHTKAEYPGTGIGLAVCKKIVEKHGGKIWVESEVDKGSTFYFTIKEKVEKNQLN